MGFCAGVDCNVVGGDAVVLHEVDDEMPHVVVAGLGNHRGVEAATAKADEAVEAGASGYCPLRLVVAENDVEDGFAYAVYFAHTLHFEVRVGENLFDGNNFVICEGEMLKGGEVVIELGNGRSADDDAGDILVAEKPSEGHLGKALAALLCDGIELTGCFNAFGSYLVKTEESCGFCCTAISGDTIEVFAGEESLGERREADYAAAVLRSEGDVFCGAALEHRGGILAEKTRHIVSAEIVVALLLEVKGIF